MKSGGSAVWWGWEEKEDPNHEFDGIGQSFTFLLAYQLQYSEWVGENASTPNTNVFKK